MIFSQYTILYRFLGISVLCSCACTTRHVWLPPAPRLDGRNDGAVARQKTTPRGVLEVEVGGHKLAAGVLEEAEAGEGEVVVVHALVEPHHLANSKSAEERVRREALAARGSS